MFPARVKVVSVTEKSTSTFQGHEVRCEISGAGIAPQALRIEVERTASAGKAELAALRLLERWCREYLKSVDATKST